MSAFHEDHERDMQNPEYKEAFAQATRFVLAERERELLLLKGPCSNRDCRLHYAHAGPCDTTRVPPIECPNEHGPDGIVACWSPGGPCPDGRTACEMCGPCQTCGGAA